MHESSLLYTPFHLVQTTMIFHNGGLNISKNNEQKAYHVRV